jgi:hypothetical protein
MKETGLIPDTRAQIILTYASVDSPTSRRSASSLADLARSRPTNAARSPSWV